jgi:hypothetical protein
MTRKYIFVSGLLGVVVLMSVYYLVGKPLLQDRTISVTSNHTVENTELSFSFSYPSGEAGYALIEPPVASTSELKQAYLLIENDEYISFQAAESTAEAPPTISIFVFDTPERTDANADVGRVTRLQSWAANYPQYSGYTTIDSEPEVTEVDGATALRYTSAGVYEQEVYLVSYQRKTYVFVGQYIEQTDPIRTTFTDLMESVLFE